MGKNLGNPFRISGFTYMNPVFSLFLFYFYLTQMDRLFKFPKQQQIAFRLHIDDDTITLKSVSDNLSKYRYHSGHIVAYEVDAERPHFQGYLMLSAPDKDQNCLRAYLKKLYGVKGNSDYSLRFVKSSKDYQKYLIKEGLWMSQGFDAQKLIDYQLVSFPKAKGKLMDELDDMEVQFLKNDITDEQYVFLFCKLKAKYKQVINTTYIKQRLLMLIARKDDNRLRQYARRVAEEVRSYG